MLFRNQFSRILSPNRVYNNQPMYETGYSLCTIEFDDQGELWNPAQLHETLTYIQEKSKTSADGQVVVVTFVHGWMHNAAPQDENFEAFKNLLSKLAKSEADYAAQNRIEARPVIGVYLAWRGLLWNLPLIKYFTFWSRKTAALRVGNISCTEVLFRIIKAVKAKNVQSQCIFVGHSFGALILENAICKALLAIIFQNENGVAESPCDLVVLINPACEASGAKQFMDILKRNNVTVRMGEQKEKDGLPFPLLVSITSAEDRATRLAFPVGQFFVNLTKSFRPYHEPGLPSQWHLNTHTAGHVPYFHNFLVNKFDHRQINKEKLEFSFKAKVGKIEEEYKYEIVPKGNKNDLLPFWLMQVPKEIIPDHSTIFTEASENMLSALLDWTIASVEPTKLKCNSDE